MYVYEIAALAAAALWAVTGLIATTPSQHLGAIAFNRYRMLMVFAVLAAYVTVVPGWGSIGSAHLLPLILSGFIGIFLGDTALFLSLNRLGPRRTAMLFSLNAPISALLGWIILGETLSGQALAGVLVAFAGVILAIGFGKRRSQLHQWEAIKGPLWIGLVLGLAAALSQSVGSLIARPIMEAGVDPVAASALRIGVAAFGLTLIAALPTPMVKAQRPMTLGVGIGVAMTGIMGMGIGMTLILFALSGGEVGIISTLSATTPAIQLPLLWARTRECPALGAWIGAALVVIGCALIFGV